MGSDANVGCFARFVCRYGGAEIRTQFLDLERGCDILVRTGMRCAALSLDGSFGVPYGTFRRAGGYPRRPTRPVCSALPQVATPGRLVDMIDRGKVSA